MARWDHCTAHRAKQQYPRVIFCCRGCSYSHSYRYRRYHCIRHCRILWLSRQECSTDLKHIYGLSHRIWRTTTLDIVLSPGCIFGSVGCLSTGCCSESNIRVCKYTAHSDRKLAGNSFHKNHHSHLHHKLFGHSLRCSRNHYCISVQKYIAAHCYRDNHHCL